MLPPSGTPTNGTPTNAERIAQAAQRIAQVSDTPRLDAEILLAAALGISRSRLLARLFEQSDAPDFDAMVVRRLAYEPLAYILGEWEFFSLTFKVLPPLLVPRPETEHLVEAVLDHMGCRPARVLDLCTGTGCVAIAIAHSAPNSRVTATDINPLAISVAAENAQRNAVSDRTGFILQDLFPNPDEPFDAICSNPPYIEESAWDELSPVIRLHEDPNALLAGPDGLDIVRRIIAEAPQYLNPGGLLAMEIDGAQRPAVEKLLRDGGYHDVHFRQDLAGIDRIACATM